MPYPSKVEPKQIVDTASAMIEEIGVESLSLAKLASRLGVKAPSLYRYFNGKTALLRAVNTKTITALNTFVRDEAQKAPTPRERVIAMAHAYRQFALEHPALYGLAYTNTIDDLRPADEDLAPLSLELESIVAEYVGKEQGLVALRGLWAISHGFVMLELCDQFWRGGDLDAAFATAVESYIRGLPSR
ncbi:MAG: TetR/AcrR family transcriptional regulator [Anaerolineae bacterium]